MSLAFRLLPAIPVAALLLASVARAESKVSAVVGAEAGYGSNPFLGTGEGEQTGTLTLSAAPTLSLVGPTSSLDLTGRVEQSFFTKRYGDITNWSLGAGAGVKLSPLSDLSFQAAYSSSVSSGLYSTIIIPNPDGTIPPPDPSATDIAGQRSRTLSGRAGFSSRISLRDTLSLSVNALRTDYPSTLNSSNTGYGGSVSVSHIFSDRVSAGLGLSYSRSDYEQAFFGSSSSYSPNVNATLRLAPRFILEVSVGASFNKISGVGGGPTKAYFSGSANLCNKGDRGSLCVIASRSIGATAQAGNSTVTLIGGNYSYALTRRSSFNLGGNYSSTKSIGLGSSYETSYVSASAGYNLQLTQRLSFVVNTRYTDPIKSIGQRGKSFYGGAGVTYRFGR